MRMTRLRLTGFKSFVEPTELRIEPGLTGIVGPNGCGKSNLLEAIRWVMGESSPKSMRGGGMDDVIFAGTEARPARDFAEVALVCDTEGAPLPGLVSEGEGGALEVVRRIERGAGSAYRANGRDVRARDVALIFADAATGAHSPALVSQGKVAAIIAAKPQERRLLLEEAAGISGLHVRRKEAESKLRQTEGNLARLAELLADMDARAGQLRRQAKAAERYARLSEAIRITEGRMIYARWRDAAAQADAARAEAQAAEARVAEAQARQEQGAAEQAAAVAAMAAARDAATAAREAEHRLSTRLGEERAALATIERRIADIAAEMARIARDRDAEDALAREGAAAIERLSSLAKQAQQAIAAEDAKRPALTEANALAADRARDAEVALAGARADAANDHAERRIAEAALADAERRASRIAAEQARIAQSLAEAGDSAALETAALGARAEADAAAQRIGQAEAEIAAAGIARQEAATRIAETETRLAEARAALTALESEAAALERSLAASAGDDGALIAALRVEPGYEAALAVALGDELSAPLGKDKGRGWAGGGTTQGPSLPAGVTPLTQVVNAPAQLAARLAQIGVVDEDKGQALAVGQRLVTRNGHMRRWDGFVASGDGAAAAERLVRANRREAIRAQIPPMAAALAQIEQEHGNAQHLLGEADAALAAARGTLSAAEEESRRLARAADAADAAYERWRTTAGHLAERQQASEAEADEASEALDIARTAVAALPDGQVVAERLASAEAEAEAARLALAQAREGLTMLDRAIAREREAQVESEAEMRGWKARAGEAARRIAGMAAREAEITAERDSIAARPEALTRQIELSEREREAAQASVTAALADERATAEAARTAEALLDAAREALAAAREERAGATARAENAESRRIEMGRISGERFECPPPLLPAKAGFAAEEVASPAEESAAHERLTQDRERIGPVNLIAAQELAELEATQTTSAAEAEELQLAVNRLRGSIGHLNREGRQRLTDAFEKVDGHFRSLFVTLFGGGQAHLALVDSDDPLEAGLEIMAQPPGKKLASLTLLSGGEQALTAIALIFALFLTNPAPICVLDEVDAPLDDANVDRFCDLLERMTRETATRYLIVTHNAVTMARMHRLFGVTMVERGVSRLVSVDLGAAEELLAAE